MMPVTQVTQGMPKDFWSQSPYLAAILAVVAATLYYMDRQNLRAREAQKERDQELREYLEARDEILMQSMNGVMAAARTNQKSMMDALERNSRALEDISKALGPVMTVLDLKALKHEVYES